MQRDLPLPTTEISARAASPPRANRFDAILQRVHPRLASSIRQDISATRRLAFPFRLVALVPAVVAVPTFIYFGLLRTGIYEIYSESLVFLVLAVIVGGLSPGIGAALVLAVGLADLTYAVPTLFADLNRLGLTDLASQFTVVTGTLGRFVAYLALWILVVEVPLFAREARRSPWLSRLGQQAERLVGPLVVGASAGLLTTFWVLAFPLIIRAPYVWSTAEFPNAAAIIPVQTSGWPLVVAATVAGALAAFVHQWVGVAQLETVPPRPPTRFGWLVPRVLALLLLGAVISGWVDLILLVLALFGGPFLARALWSVSAVADTLQRVPAMARLLIGFGLTILIGQRIAESTFFDPNGYLTTMYGSGPTVFFPIVATIAVGVILYDLLFGPPAGLEPGRRRVASTVATTLVIPLIALAAFVMLPEVALAHDCADPGDCFSDPIALAAAAAAAAAAARRLQSHGPPQYTPGPPPGFRWKDWKDNPNMRWQYKKQLYRDRYIPTPPMLNKPYKDAKAFASSGTGTKA